MICNQDYTFWEIEGDLVVWYLPYLVFDAGIVPNSLFYFVYLRI